MLSVESAFLTLTLVSLVVGTWSIVRAQANFGRAGCCWGRYSFVATLFMLGAATLIAAVERADGLVPMGLTAGFLVVGILWEVPRQTW